MDNDNDSKDNEDTSQAQELEQEDSEDDNTEGTSHAFWEQTVVSYYWNHYKYTSVLGSNYVNIQKNFNIFCPKIILRRDATLPVNNKILLVTWSHAKTTQKSNKRTVN